MSLETFLNEFDGEEDGEDEEVLTASGVLQILSEAWINEKLCPELLPHKSEYVEVMMEQIAQMEENVSRLSSTDLRNLIHRQELERIRYLIRSYLRIRLTKIEKYSLSLFKTTGIMSPQETNYLREYLTLSVAPLKSLCDRMAGPIGNLNPKQIEISPDLETHVFARSKCDLSEALIINDDEVIVKEGSQHILPYIIVKNHIKDNRIVLI
uniref:DNA replication complex GINS protein SLD5 n=1 Tax=Triatoma dimidiata TaxID=72491 RepID=A0A0V0GCQ0_TRIDM